MTQVIDTTEVAIRSCEQCGGERVTALCARIGGGLYPAAVKGPEAICGTCAQTVLGTHARRGLLTGSGWSIRGLREALAALGA